VVGVQQGELGALARRVQALESSRAEERSGSEEAAAGAGRQAGDKAEPPPDQSPAARAEERRRREPTHQAAIDAHWREPRDPRWALQAETGFSADLERVGKEGGFKPIQVSCRDSTCVSVLEWPSRDDAVNNITAVLHQKYTVNCSKRLLLPTSESPPAAGTPFRATAFFDCRRAKDGIE
jgi:hypothetical protein